MAYLMVPHTNQVQTGIVREFDTDYVISEDYFAETKLSITITSSSQDTTVTLYAGPDPDPITAVASVRSAAAVLLGLVSIQTTVQSLLAASISAGFHVKLVKTGDGDATIDNVQETIYNDQPF